jgi:hypothetical protein
VAGLVAVKMLLRSGLVKLKHSRAG